MQNKENNQRNRNQIVKKQDQKNQEVKRSENNSFQLELGQELGKNQQRNERNRNQVEKQQINNFQFEMGNELGANIEQEKTMFKNEYEKDKLKRRNRENNNFSTNKNQFK